MERIYSFIKLLAGDPNSFAFCYILLMGSEILFSLYFKYSKTIILFKISYKQKFVKNRK